MTGRGYVEDVRMSNIRLVLGTIIIIIALLAQFYKKKFPENRDFLIGCIVLYPFSLPDFSFLFILWAVNSLPVPFDFYLIDEKSVTFLRKCVEEHGI